MTAHDKFSQLFADRLKTRELAPRHDNPTFTIDIPIFVYGSFMIPEVLQDALKLQPEDMPQYESATLIDYSRFKVIGASFPAIVPRQGGTVEGCLIYMKTPTLAAVLDAMEHSLYVREEVQICVAGGHERRAYAYVWKGQETELTTEPWDIAAFVKERGFLPS